MVSTDRVWATKLTLIHIGLSCYGPGLSLLQLRRWPFLYQGLEVSRASQPLAGLDTRIWSKFSLPVRATWVALRKTLLSLGPTGHTEGVRSTLHALSLGLSSASGRPSKLCLGSRILFSFYRKLSSALRLILCAQRTLCVLHLHGALALEIESALPFPECGTPSIHRTEAIRKEQFRSYSILSTMPKDEALHFQSILHYNHFDPPPQ